MIDRRTPIYLTEFGIQSHPDRIAGVGPKRQAEYLAISERIAYANPRVVAFSQYLMKDDKPRKGPRIQRYSGFETGLQTSSGRRKPSYDAFMLPLAVKRTATATCSGAACGRRPGRRRSRSSTRSARAAGSGCASSRRPASTASAPSHRQGQRYRAKWRRPGGGTVTGPPIRAY